MSYSDFERLDFVFVGFLFLSIVLNMVVRRFVSDLLFVSVVFWGVFLYLVIQMYLLREEVSRLKASKEVE